MVHKRSDRPWPHCKIVGKASSTEPGIWLIHEALSSNFLHLSKGRVWRYVSGAPGEAWDRQVSPCNLLASLLGQIDEDIQSIKTRGKVAEEHMQ